MAKLGVNIDHVATLRQARRGVDPDPVAAARICEAAGADSIVCHLREDRRHIHDEDVRQLRKTVKTRLNLEMSLSSGIVAAALKIKPDFATIVPVRLQEITTERGLDVIRYFRRIKTTVTLLKTRGIAASLFVDPVKLQIDRALETGAGTIELHTGCYSGAANRSAAARELAKLKDMTRYARTLGLTVSAGHGLNYKNTAAVARIDGIEELNIGHAIIAEAVFTGLEDAVKNMLKLTRTRT